MIWILTMVFAIWAGALDWRSRRIPNWLTVPAFVVGLTANTVTQGWTGAKTALAGAAVALMLLLPVVLLRGLGAGDWKLMGAMGSLLGWKQVLMVLLVTIFVSGIIALGQMIRQRRVWKTVANLWELIQGFFIFGLKPHPEFNLDNPGSVTLPFGVAAAAATLLCYAAAAAGL